MNFLRVLNITGTILSLIVIFTIDTKAQEFPLELINLPEGFKIEIFAEDIPNARSLNISPAGTVFVGNRTGGKVYALVDHNKDYKADKKYVLASDMFYPNGVAFRDGDLFVAEINRVIKYENIEEQLGNPPEPVIVNDSYPGITHHGWKFIAFGPDDKLYVPIGAPCNICEREDERFSAITRMNPDGTGFEVYAHGVRNTVGFDWHPETGDLWFTDNGRDHMGDNLPPDELNRAQKKGQHFGYPYCHAGRIPDPKFGTKMPCEDTVPPQQELGPHVAALGMRFYTGDMFPAEYKNRIFIAEHGSWNRSTKIGYRIMQVTLDENGNASDYSVFADGWLQPEEKVWGRPVDVEIMADGSMLISDDYAGIIYRVTYEP